MPRCSAHTARHRPGFHLLVLTLHHIIFDGWSIGVFGQELAELYRAYSSGKQSAFAPCPSICGLRCMATEVAGSRRTRPPTRLLEEAARWFSTGRAFPPDHRRPSAIIPRSTIEIGCDGELASAVHAMSQRHGVTLFMVLLAAFKVLLARYTGQDDIVVGSASASRTRAEFYQVMGFFVNNLVLRTEVNGEPVSVNY